MDVVDRRLNPPNKSLDNRQRFIRRQRPHLKKAVQDILGERSIGDRGSQGIDIPGSDEPVWDHDHVTGKRDRVLPGNREYVRNDEIDRNFDYMAGRGGSPWGDGINDFKFILTFDEFVDLFFEDMELPDLFKNALKTIEFKKPFRDGYSRYGSTVRLDKVRTLRNSLARRIAHHRPSIADREQAEARIRAFTDDVSPDLLDAALKLLWEIEQRQARVPFIDPVDARYRRFELKPVPGPQAVMFALMDVSGSMDEYQLDLAKRFFLLLGIFLIRKYKHVEVVYIRHTHEAKEVDEHTFFHSPESGGTIVSTALQKMQDIIRERYPLEGWNIYGAQISDGENYGYDNERCIELLSTGAGALLGVSQYFAYIETDNPQQRQYWEEWRRKFGASGYEPPEETALWEAYSRVLTQHENFAMQKVHEKTDIGAVFGKLFSRNREKVGANAKT
jgi:uncharacterized sporulation protein YeaH/YhbH (DUF444 family)